MEKMYVKLFAVCTEQMRSPYIEHKFKHESVVTVVSSLKVRSPRGRRNAASVSRHTFLNVICRGYIEYVRHTSDHDETLTAVPRAGKVISYVIHTEIYRIQ